MVKAGYDSESVLGFCCEISKVSVKKKITYPSNSRRIKSIKKTCQLLRNIIRFTNLENCFIL
jgi:hypothetical protein